jgi:hypothetical protein
VKEECTYNDPNFPVVFLTKEERRTLSFWCPKTVALIDETNTLELIRLWNRKPWQVCRSKWINRLRFRSTTPQA